MERPNFPIRLRTLKSTAILLIAALVLAATFVLKVQANETGARLIVLNGNAADTNLIKFQQTEYVGQCPGTSISSGSRRGQFVSSSTPPAPNRRVIIRNVTEGMNSDPYPYTDREYDKSRYSEGFSLYPGTSHDQQNFSVLKGENKFEYEIRENDKVIEQSSFTAQVSIKDQGVFSRESICEEKLTCYDRERDCNNRKDKYQICHPTTSCTCPN